MLKKDQMFSVLKIWHIIIENYPFHCFFWYGSHYFFVYLVWVIFLQLHNNVVYINIFTRFNSYFNVSLQTKNSENEYDIPSPFYSDVRSLMQFTEAEQSMNFLKNKWTTRFQNSDEFCLNFYLRMFKSCIPISFVLNRPYSVSNVKCKWEKFFSHCVEGHVPPMHTYGW